jgi:mono/diheme cytochrome c family protein
MANRALGWLVLISLTAGANTLAWAQDTDVGKSEYESMCAACHGADGKGPRPLRNQLNTAPSDSAVLAKRNVAVFPVSAVYQVIDGRTTIAAHGTHQMPIWDAYSFLRSDVVGARLT